MTVDQFMEKHNLEGDLERLLIEDAWNEGYQQGIELAKHELLHEGINCGLAIYKLLRAGKKVPDIAGQLNVEQAIVWDFKEKLNL